MRKILYIIFTSCIMFMGCRNKDELFNYMDVDENDGQLDKNFDTIRDEERENITVHITGEVRRRGVYDVEKGSRVIDLVKVAGGFTEKANQDAVNLAEILVDGKKIYIPSIDDKVIFSEQSDSNDIVDINTATKEKLMTLPNIGEKTAESIIKFREENQFTSFEDLMKISGLGKKKLEGLKGLISLGGEIYE